MPDAQWRCCTDRSGPRQGGHQNEREAYEAACGARFVEHRRRRWEGMKILHRSRRTSLGGGYGLRFERGHLHARALGQAPGGAGVWPSTEPAASLGRAGHLYGAETGTTTTALHPQRLPRLPPARRRVKVVHPCAKPGGDPSGAWSGPAERDTRRSNDNTLAPVSNPMPERVNLHQPRRSPYRWRFVHLWRSWLTCSAPAAAQSSPTKTTERIGRSPPIDQYDPVAAGEQAHFSVGPPALRCHRPALPRCVQASSSQSEIVRLAA